jgi:hypothetical protein
MEPLPSSDKGIPILVHRLMATEMGSGSGITNLMRGGGQKHTTRWLHKPTLILKNGGK